MEKISPDDFDADFVREKIEPIHGAEAVVAKIGDERRIVYGDHLVELEDPLTKAVMFECKDEAEVEQLRKLCLVVKCPQAYPMIDL